mgnify:CR=1 FL=1
MIRLDYQWLKYVLILMLSMVYVSAHGQFEAAGSEPRGFYGTNINQSVNGLVLNRTVLNGQYQLNRRTFEVGLLMNEFRDASGFVFKHRYFLNNTKEEEEYNPESYSIRPHVFYRFVYNNQMPENCLNYPIHAEEVSFSLTEHSVHTINTIEHYLGLGLEIDLVKNIYLNTSVSGGFYFFKDNMDAVRQDDQLLPEATTGFVFSVSTGIGCHF